MDIDINAHTGSRFFFVQVGVQILYGPHTFLIALQQEVRSMPIELFLILFFANRIILRWPYPYIIIFTL